MQAFNHEVPSDLKSRDGTTIKVVKNFKYLGAWIESTEKYINVRKAPEWKACHNLRKIWTSKIRKNLKTRLFVATIEAVLLYGVETRTLTKSLTKQLDGCYTRMVYNISWKDHMRNAILYGKLPAISLIIKQRRMCLYGHCYRHGHARRGRNRISYTGNLLADTGACNTNELAKMMNVRDDWK